MRHSLAGEPLAVEMLVRALKLFNEAGQGLRTAARPQLPLELAFVEATLRLGSASAPASQCAGGGWGHAQGRGSDQEGGTTQKRGDERWRATRRGTAQTTQYADCDTARSAENRRASENAC